MVLSHLNFGILLWGFKCDKVFKFQNKFVRILSLSKYNAHKDALFKQLKLLKVNDILKLQELKLYYKYKNNKLPHYLQTLPFHPNAKTHDHDTHLKHHIHPPRGKHAFAKNCVHCDIPRIVNNCSNSILDKVNTHSMQGYSGYIKTHFLQTYKQNCTIVNCYVCDT